MASDLAIVFGTIRLPGYATGERSTEPWSRKGTTELQRMFWLFVILAVGIGASGVLQAGINNQVRILTGDAFRAALLSTSVSTGTLLVVATIYHRGRTLEPAHIGQMHWWMWTAGVIGAIFVAASALLVARLGSAMLFMLIVAGQLVGAVVMDHFGWLGLEKHEISIPRILGVSLVMAGVVLVRRY
jgi:transporter family-2 protein